jgi:hypothetical protein
MLIIFQRWTRGLLARNKQVVSFAAYSRSSSNSKSPYKVVHAKIKSEFIKFEQNFRHLLILKIRNCP